MQLRGIPRWSDEKFLEGICPVTTLPRVRGDKMKMNSTKGSVRARLLTSTLLAGLASVAAPMAVTLVATAVPTLASAQDYSSGTLSGTVMDSSGVPIAGAAVTVKSLSQGFERTLTTDSSGAFRVPLIPTGGYSVAINKEGFKPTSDGNVRVGLGGSSAFTFTLTGEGEVDAIIVTGTANPQLDFAATTTGLTIDLETLSKQVPIARNITSVTLLAPGAVRGTQFGNSAGGARIAAQPTLGGSSAAENAFYINGLNITNFNTYLGASTVPFDFYKTVEVKTGGYAAEFGRATGGIVNSVTKSGGNDFTFNVSGNYQPTDLENFSPDTYLVKGNRVTSDLKDLTFQVSGPIIEDRLFFYVLNQQRDNESTNGSITGSSYTVDKSNDPFWGVKLDGFITDRQHVELTWFDTTRTTNRTTYGFTGATNTIGAKQGTTVFQNGGQNWVAKYTGSFTDWFTLSAAYGITEDSDSSLPADTTTPFITDSRSGTALRLGTQTAGSTSEITTKREFYRVDGDLYFDLFGKHHIRAGYEKEKLTLNNFSTPTGGLNYDYLDAQTGDVYGVANTDSCYPGTSAAPCAIPNALSDDYVEISRFVNGGTFEGENTAVYIQDSWDILENLTLQLGVRYDKFENFNPAGEAFISFDKDTIGPRLGFSWDPTNDGKNKVFGSFGRYYLPVASNTAFRMTGAELFFSEFYKVTAINPVTGLPTLGSQITQATVNAGGGTANLSICPPGGATPGADACEVTADGTPIPTDSTVSKNLKPTYQDEFILGYERQFSPLWKAGVTLSYRDLGQAAEDSAIDAAVLAYCDKNGIAGCEDIWTGFHQYVIVNPGDAQTITLSDAINGESKPRTVSFTSADLGYPKVKREYVGLEFSFERAFDGKWSLQGSYVLSESKGNYEGAVKSDVGQTDASITQDFDQPGLTDGSYGLLPNHRAHQLKMFGTYAITDNLAVGANLTVLSPHKLGCLGRHPTDGFAALYGASSFYCLRDPTNASSDVLTPRGSLTENDWQTSLDLQARFTVPSAYTPGDLTLRMDVFNVFNTDAITNSQERGTLTNGNYSPNYGKPTAYQQPRYVRFGFDWAF
jgi:outer membrane receptor protein involved in Fe transport